MIAPRIERQAHLRARLDALLVTHPANIAYLTGLTASTANVIVLRTPPRCLLIVDSRYATTARTLEAHAPGLTVRVASGSLDADAAAQLRELGVARLGIEADHLSVARFNRLTAMLVPSATARPAHVLEPTARIVERMRAVKDAGEIETLREAGRRISAGRATGADLDPAGTDRATDRRGRRCGDARRGIRSARLRDDRRVRAECRPAARPADQPGRGGQ